MSFSGMVKEELSRQISTARHCRIAEIAELRLQYPEATLKELGMMLNPQVGKSGVNHRLRKLSEIADELRMNEEDLL